MHSCILNSTNIIRVCNVVDLVVREHLNLQHTYICCISDHLTDMCNRNVDIYQGKSHVVCGWINSDSEWLNREIVWVFSSTYYFRNTVRKREKNVKKDFQYKLDHRPNWLCDWHVWKNSRQAANLECFSGGIKFERRKIWMSKILKFFFSFLVSLIWMSAHLWNYFTCMCVCVGGGGGGKRAPDQYSVFCHDRIILCH